MLAVNTALLLFKKGKESNAPLAEFLSGIIAADDNWRQGIVHHERFWFIRALSFYLA